MNSRLFSAETSSPANGTVNGAAILPFDDRIDCSLRRGFVDEFFSRQVSAVQAGSRVLDLGGHRSPRRGRFDIDRYNFRVRSANLSALRRPDVQTDASSLPFRGESFDVIICAELLEHVPDPLAVLKEAHRALRSQGVLLISVPFLFHIHADPHDYGRYTDQFWRENLDRIGFRDVVIEKQGLFWSVIVDMMRGWMCEHIRAGRLRSAWLRQLVTILFAKGKRWALASESKATVSDGQYVGRYTTGFGIRAVKP